MTVRVGISGWTYPPWRGVFYPTGLPHRRELAYAASQFSSIEINGSFYSLQRPTSYYQWANQTPSHFMFSVKGGRFITHMKRLREVETALPNFFASGMLALNEKLGPVLWQLPPSLPFDVERIGAFLAQLPRSTGEAAYLARRHDARLAGRSWTGTFKDRPLRHAIEVRHESFRSAEFVSLLRDQQIGLVVADAPTRWPRMFDLTSDFVYVRLHGSEELYTSGYGPGQLNDWANRCRDWASQGLDVFVYFDNDAKVRAPHDALALEALLKASG
jgi:uncharacterized protein YecE (DUF72 family)